MQKEVDNRSLYFSFIPFCLMVKYEWCSAIKLFGNFLMDNEINIIQMPCVEATYKNNFFCELMGIS